MRTDEVDGLDLARFAVVIGAALPPELDPDLGVDIRHTAIHSRSVIVGAPFFALPGRRDGRAFATEAIERGAVAAVAAAGGGRVPPATLLVDDPLVALQRLAAWRRRRLTARVVAVVGSVGKTTTKDALVTFLSPHHRVFGSPGSFNSQIGVPLAVLRCPVDAELAVIEAAATAPGEMARLRAIVAPHDVLVTGFGARHRGYFGSDPERAAELLSMAAELPNDGWIMSESFGDELVKALPSGVTALDSRQVRWPVVGFERANQLHRLHFDDGHDLIVRSPLGVVATDVALAAVASRRLIGPPLPDEYQPSAPASKVWRTPGETLVLRAAVVDDPVAWRGLFLDAAANTRPGGRCIVVVTANLETISPGTVVDAFDSPVAASAHEVWCVADRAARLPDDLAVRTFESERDLAAALRAELRANDVIAILGPRSLDLEAVSPSLLEAMAPSRLYIDSAAIAANVSSLQRSLGPDTRIMAVIKGDAYGTEPVSMARLLERTGIDHFAVASADEGVALRRAGIASPVLVLLPSVEELAKAQRHGLAVAVQSQPLLDAVVALGSAAPLSHVDLDTGMHRTGLAVSGAEAVLRRLVGAGVPLVGLMTHLASADDPEQDEFTLAQLKRFAEVSDTAASMGLGLQRHVLNTAGAVRFAGHRYEFARLGIGLMGVAPSGACSGVTLEPALSLVSEVVSTRELQPGDRVGYGGDFEATRPMKVAVVPLGYHDGITRAFAGNGEVVVDGVRCPVVGRVNMDSTVIDVSGTDAEAGATVVIFGSLDGSQNAIEAVAASMGTIAYEVLCRIGSRVQRVFVDH